VTAGSGTIESDNGGWSSAALKSWIVQSGNRRRLY